MQHDDESTRRIFRSLRERPHDERDPEAAWRRLRARLDASDPVTASGRGPVWARFGWLLGHEGVVAAACVLLVAAILWGGGERTEPPVAPAPAAADSTDSSGPLVLVTEPENAEPATTPPAPGATASRGYSLDVRIVRTLANEQSPVAPAGAGGADPLGDIRATLEAAFPAASSFEVTDTWAGDFAPDDTTRPVPLADGRALFFGSSTVADSGDIVLRNVRYGAADGPEVAAELSLQPGRVYVIGLPGSSEVLLAVRLRQQEPPAPESGSDDGDR